MPLQKHLRFLLGLLYAALALGAVFLLLPGLLPFLLGWVISCLLEPIVRFLCEKVRLRRGWSAAAVLLVFTALAAVGGYFLLRRLWFELTALSTKLPVWVDFIQELSQKLDNLIYRWNVAVSPDIRAVLQTVLTRTMEQISALFSSLGAALLEWCADGLLALPHAALFLFTAFLSCYFFLSGRPDLNLFFRKQIPQRWLPRLDTTVGQLKRALGSWLRAQGILMAVTFLLLGSGFLLLGVETAILLAAGIALLDALPVFGTGTVLIPWAFFSVLGGNMRQSLALVGLYAVLWLTRSLLEPKLIANRSGLHPLAALFAMYLGFSLFGVAGILLAPLAAVLVRQLHSSGVIKLWKE